MNLVKVCVICGFLLIAGCASVQVKSGNPGKGAALLSEEEEIKFGHYVDASIRNDFIVLLPRENPKANQKVNEIARSLAKVSDRPKLKYTARILNTPLVNAFAGPGGYIYITTGLLEFAESKDEVAGVLAHEVGHVAARHVVKQYRNAVYAQNLVSLLRIGAGLKGYDARAVGNLSNLTALFFLSSYGRDFERQADYLGTKYVIQAGYNPQGLISLLKHLWEEKEKGKREGLDIFFRSHPHTQERIKNIKGHIRELKG